MNGIIVLYLLVTFILSTQTRAKLIYFIFIQSIKSINLQSIAFNNLLRGLIIFSNKLINLSLIKKDNLNLVVCIVVEFNY